MPSSGRGATLIAVLLGLALGMAAGYFGGWVDAGFSRMTEFTMASPVLATTCCTLLQLGLGQALWIEWTTSSWTTITPVVAIASTVLAFAAFGEGLRRAFDPRSTA